MGKGVNFLIGEFIGRRRREESQTFRLAGGIDGLEPRHLVSYFPRGLRDIDRFMQQPVRIFPNSFNFVRIHQTLRVTPAMEAGISNHVWSLEEIVGLLP